MSSLDSTSTLTRHFMPHQIAWIQAEQAIHAQRRQVMALAEKSVRIGWTYADAFKNVRKRLWFKDRDYLFATKDWPSALEYIRQCYKFAEIFNLTRTVKSHGEELLSVNRLDDSGHPSAFTEDVRIGIIKFDNGSRIIAFSSSPQAMAAHGGDVGLDEFAKHPRAKLLWETAQGRVSLGHDLAVWSAHDGEDTLFNEFAHEARAACVASPGVAGAVLNLWRRLTNPAATLPPPPSGAPILAATSAPALSKMSSGWNLYFRVTMPNAIDLGLIDVINRSHGTHLNAQQFLADCRARARHEEIFQQSYLCNPLGAAAANIVEWSAIERCRHDYEIERVHLEDAGVRAQFGEFSPLEQQNREYRISSFLHKQF